MDDVKTEKDRHLQQMSNAELRALLRENADAVQEDEKLTEAILGILEARPCEGFEVAALREDFDTNYRDLREPLYPVELPGNGNMEPRGENTAVSKRYLALSVRILGRTALIAALVCSLMVAVCAASIDVRAQIVDLIVSHVSAADTPPTPEEIASGVSNFSGFVKFIWINLF